MSAYQAPNSAHGHLTAYDMKTGKQVWRAYSTGPDAMMLVDPEKTTHSGEADRQGLEPELLGGRSMEDRRRHDVGMVFL